MPKKILHIISSKSWRGGEQQVDYLLNYDSDEFENYLFCVENCELSNRNKHKKDKIFTYKKSWGFNIFAAIELKKVCKKIQINLIHLHDSHSINTYIVADLLGMNIPCIIHRHVNFSIKNKWKYKYKKIQKIICVSNEVKKSFTNFIREEKLVVINPGIDVNRFIMNNKRLTINKLKNELNISNETKLIGIVSALEPEKNIEEFMEIANKILEKRNDVKFVVIGDGSLKSEIINLIPINIETKIHFLGFRNDIPEILSCLDMFLFTSKNEGFGQVLLEAMAAKVLVITSNFATAKEIVQHEKTGYIYKNISNAIELINKILTTHDSRLIITENAFNFIQKFDIKEMNEKIDNIYRTIIYHS